MHHRNETHVNLYMPRSRMFWSRLVVLYLLAIGSPGFAEGCVCIHIELSFLWGDGSFGRTQQEAQSWRQGVRGVLRWSLRTEDRKIFLFTRQLRTPLLNAARSLHYLKPVSGRNKLTWNLANCYWNMSQALPSSMFSINTLAPTGSKSQTFGLHF